MSIYLSYLFYLIFFVESTLFFILSVCMYVCLTGYEKLFFFSCYHSYFFGHGEIYMLF